MNPTLWMRPASTNVTLADARPTTALERPVANLRCGAARLLCRNHGGASPQALAKAQAAIERADMKIRGLAIPAVDAISGSCRQRARRSSWLLPKIFSTAVD